MFLFGSISVLTGAFSLCAGINTVVNVLWTNTCHIYNGLLLSRVYLFRECSDYKHYKMSYHRKSTWTDVCGNGDSYGRTVSSCFFLSIGSSDTLLNYCRAFVHALRDGGKIETIYHSHLEDNKNLVLGFSILIYVNWHVSSDMLTIHILLT